MLVWNSRNATSRQRSKELNINCAELFSPPALLPGAAAQVQGSHRSPAECSVSITGTSHGAVTREAASHPPYLWPQRSANQLRPHMHAYSTWAWSHKALRAHLPLPLWSRYKYTCTVSEDRKKPRIFSLRGLREDWERAHGRSSCEIVKQQFPHPSELRFAMTRRVFSEKLPALKLRWQLLSGWAFNTYFTPAADNACGVMTVAVPHRILYCILGFFLTGHLIMKLLRIMHTKKRLCGKDLRTNAKLLNYISFLIYDHELWVITDLNWMFCPHTVAQLPRVTTPSHWKGPGKVFHFTKVAPVDICNGFWDVLNQRRASCRLRLQFKVPFLI